MNELSQELTAEELRELEAAEENHEALRRTAIFL
jgi:hypothetical protein